MANYSITDLESMVRLRGNYESSIKFTSAYVQAEIQTAYGEYYELLANTHEGWWDTFATGATVAAQSYVTLPPDCWRVTSIDVLSGSDYIVLDQCGLKDRNTYGSSPGLPRAFRLTARGAELYPTPDATYTLRITYTPTYTPLTTSPVNFYNDWHDYVVVGALKRLAERQKMPTADLDRELMRVRERIVNAATERKAAEPEYLNLHDVPDWGGWYY